MELLEAEVALLRNEVIAPNSRKIYINSNVKFIYWLLCHKPSILTTEFVEIILKDDEEFFIYVSAYETSDLSESDRSAISLITTDNETMERISKKIKESLQNRICTPLTFELLKAEDFLCWLMSLTKSNGERPGAGAYSTHRSGLFNLFRDYKVSMSLQMQSEMKDLFIALKRRISLSIGRGIGRATIGKVPLEFSLYAFLGLNLLKQSKKEFTFAHCFMIYCWNLMCRASNAASICANHVGWTNDSMNIVFAHMKNDQFGDRPRDPRHVYANPIIPEICPILALGIYLLSFGFDQNSEHLFPGGNQYDRYRRVIMRLFEDPVVKLELDQRGIGAEELGKNY